MSIPLEAAISAFFSHTNCLGKPPPEVLVESWHTTSGNKVSSQDDMGCRELSSRCCAEIGVPLDLRLVSQGISGVAERKSSHLSCMMWNAGWLLR